MFVSTPDRNWVFGNDQIVNDNKPMPCADEDSKDIAYIRKIMEWINSQPEKFDAYNISIRYNILQSNLDLWDKNMSFNAL